ncbi:MAG: hypothetical protein H6624_20010 [Bdellovibrionaceae bacterium]|nr:hypothetical protein [Bdellovibrionales bacterium]MCB9086632.1 hypothetical protein [Pseudobdellovibrionaceae bacterium]MCB9086637.1 hypothetical protein [Pseudobdellovibrionaceae bacterium]
MMTVSSTKLLALFLCLGLSWSAALGGTTESFAFRQPFLVKQSMAVPSDSVFFPRFIRPERRFLNGQLVFSASEEITDGVSVIRAGSNFCVVNAFRWEEDQNAWEKRIPFNLHAGREFQAPLRRASILGGFESLELFGDSTTLIIVCLRRLENGNSIPLPISQAVLEDVFSGIADWNISGLDSGVDPRPGSEEASFGPINVALYAHGPDFEKPSQIIKGKTQIVTDTGGIAAGWARVGSLTDAIRDIAFEAGVSIDTDGSANIAGRAVSWVVKGTQEQVDKFNRLIAAFIKANETSK